MSRDEDSRAYALAMHELLRRYQFQDVEQVCEYGITLTECHALELIVLAGSLSVNDVAGALRVNKSTASRVVQSLAEKKLLRRERSGNDARAWKLAATAAGRTLFEQILQGSARCYGAMLDGLSAEERAIGLEILGRLAGLASCSPSKT
jgi:DNA-binding MarR family transcriptional regulator